MWTDGAGEIMLRLREPTRMARVRAAPQWELRVSSSKWFVSPTSVPFGTVTHVGYFFVRGSGARLRRALRSRVLMSTSQSQASARVVCDFGWRGMRRARATGDVGKGVGLVVTKRIDDGDATRRYGYDRIVTRYKNDVPGRCVGAVVG